MRLEPLSDEALKQAVAYRDEYGTITAAAKALNIARTTLSDRLKSAAKRGFDTRNPGEGFEVFQTSERTNADGTVVSRSVTSKQAPGEVYKPLPGFIVDKESAYVDPDHRLKGKWVKTHREAGHQIALLEAIKEAVADVKAHPMVPAPDYVDEDLLTTYPLPDLHLGQKSWGLETGSNYDLDIAHQYATETTSSLIAQSPPSKDAAIVIMGDYLHANDNTAVTPTHKHPLDVDGRHQKVLMSGVDLACSMVSMALQKHENVIVRCLIGNHDPEAAPAIAVALHAAYRDTPRVKMDLSPKIDWFHQHGRCLIGATHGHTIAVKDQPLSMAASVPDLWGKTEYRVYFSGHRHSMQVQEIGGVVCRVLSAATARDAFAAGRSYFSHRGLSAFVYHKDHGPWIEIMKMLPPVSFIDASNQK